LLDAMSDAWRRDLEADGMDAALIAQRLERSDAMLGAAPVLVVPFMTSSGTHPYPDQRRSFSERDMFVLSTGAAIQNLLLAFHTQGYASAWVSSGIFCRETAREALGLGTVWESMGTIGVGPLPADQPPTRPALELDEHLRFG
jgi:coenzyme F420-0:L-glutamate ligase / coenzyme F420-1:gamma-L-glutamate ligase